MHAVRLALACVLGFALLAPLGCARAARDTTGFGLEHELTVDAPFDTTWQTVKQVLREQEYDIHTRDKRGRFVAYSRETRGLSPKPRRVKHVIEIEPLGEDTTRVTIESMRQVYGVTLLTHPNWHDRPTDDPTEALAVLDALRTHLQDPA
jgi:uncharacterized lipoprotein